MQSRARLLELLDHHEFRTGTSLGAELGISRAAVHKHIARLRRAGLPVDSVPAKGYKLADGVVPLRAGAIRDGLQPQARSTIGRIFVEQSVDSTNDYLHRLPGDIPSHGAVCIAECQSSGRGRRGNRWIASGYRNLLMSLRWEYDRWPQAVTGVAVAVGVAIIDALNDLGVNGPGMKWPNDIVLGERKLGGILIDVGGESTGACRLIVGIGINVEITEADAGLIQQPWIDLAGHTVARVDRNRLAAACLNRLVDLLSHYDERGFGYYRDRWRQVDVLRGRDVSVALQGSGKTTHGTVTGLDDNGALILRLAQGGEMICFQGDVSVRPR